MVEKHEIQSFSPVQGQAITWINDRLLSIGPLQTDFEQ